MFDAKLSSLLRAMIATIRHRRAQRIAIQAERHAAQAREKGRDKTGMWASDFDMFLAEEFESRGSEWFQLATRIMAETGTEWTDIDARELVHTVSQELITDYGELTVVFDEHTKQLGSLRTIKGMDGARDRTQHWLKQEAELRVLSADRTRVPLERLMAPGRYDSVRTHWASAHAELAGTSPNLATASAQAVHAVEALARLVVRDPNATLGEAIKVLRANGTIPSPALKGLDELWALTNSAKGVRHGGGAGPTVSPEVVTYHLGLAEAALRLLLLRDVA